ncbi:MAG TPA: hypothetical protein VEK35_06265 [Roseiarcus sp.]|nr:hypothetical protein [Roseiarcus sp.]
MARISRIGRMSLAGLVAAGVSLLASAAGAECGDDLQKLSAKRVADLAEINSMAETSKKEKKPIDPALFCAKTRGLTATEDALLAYMAKNKDWCGIPDDVIESLKASHAKSVEFGTRACVAAARAKKAQQEQQAGSAPQAPVLPTGPL